VNAEFLEGVLAIGGHGGLGKAGEVGGFLGRLAGAQEAEHFDFAGVEEGFRSGRGQEFLLAEEVGHMAGGLIAEDAVAGPGGSERGQELGTVKGLEEKGVHPGGKSADGEFRRGVAGHEHGAEGGAEFLGAGDEVQAVGVGQPPVADEDVYVLLGDPFRSREAVGTGALKLVATAGPAQDGEHGMVDTGVVVHNIDGE